MRQRKVLTSTVMLLLLATGCVKPTNEPNKSESVVYNEQPATEIVYADGTPVVYADPATNTTVFEEETIVSTENYEVGNQTTTPASTGPYDDPYASGGASSSASGGYVDPYSTGNNTGGYSNTNETYTDNNSYNNTPSNTTSTSNASYGKGIHLQIAALKDYYSAEEFKNGLSLPPKYSAYVKKGSMSKVIVTGFSTRTEAKTLADRQFPGAFIVAGSSSYSQPAPSYNPPSYTQPSTGNTNSGIGIQIGAFSSKTTARNAADSAAAGRYKAIVKSVNVRGKTLYKAIILGFSSRQEAKSAIASGQFGNAFVVTNIY